MEIVLWCQIRKDKIVVNNSNKKKKKVVSA